jgi:hypothetical protein
MTQDQRSPKERALQAIRQAPRPDRALFGSERREVALKAGATVAEIEEAENTLPRFSVTERYLAQHPVLLLKAQEGRAGRGRTD